MTTRYDEFLAGVRERGEYGGQDEAAQVTETVLRVLAQRITPGEVDDLAAQQPGPLGQTLADARPEQAESFGMEEFCRRVADAVGARPRTAEWDAGAVLSTVAPRQLLLRPFARTGRF
ncbi:DUF2267 domain-containing protein [Streptomyces galilaeus]|uniref:DUF2267 domain-containing protein n=1 Tax=Streptomyces galilaeus TaxID=33899 RepID=UPI001E2E35C8|nr:DUF2267 domain-containing protein [Streptomyces galilaeus]